MAGTLTTGGALAAVAATVAAAAACSDGGREGLFRTTDPLIAGRVSCEGVGLIVTLLESDTLALAEVGIGEALLGVTVGRDWIADRVVPASVRVEGVLVVTLVVEPALRVGAGTADLATGAATAAATVGVGSGVAAVGVLVELAFGERRPEDESRRVCNLDRPKNFASRESWRGGVRREEKEK